MRSTRRCPSPLDFARDSARVGRGIDGAGRKRLGLFSATTHYDTPRSLCVAAMSDAGLGYAPG
jgi:hypothetical protein